MEGGGESRRKPPAIRPNQDHIARQVGGGPPQRGQVLNRQAMIRYKAKAGSKRSTVLSCKASTRQPVLKILKKNLDAPNGFVPFEQTRPPGPRWWPGDWSAGASRAVRPRRARRLLAPAAR